MARPLRLRQVGEGGLEVALVRAQRPSVEEQASDVGVVVVAAQAGEGAPVGREGGVELAGALEHECPEEIHLPSSRRGREIAGLGDLATGGRRVAQAEERDGEAGPGQRLGVGVALLRGAAHGGSVGGHGLRQASELVVRQADDPVAGGPRRIVRWHPGEESLDLTHHLRRITVALIGELPELRYQGRVGVTGRGRHADDPILASSRSAR